MPFRPILLFSASILACGAPSTPPPASPDVPPRSAPPPSRSETPPLLEEAAVEAAIRDAVGGMFSPDHLGPERHAAIVERLRARPELTLDVFERLLLAPGPPPPGLASLDQLYPSVVLELVWQAAPPHVDAVAARLLRRVQEQRLHDMPTDQDARLDALGRALTRLSSGLDVPAAAGAVAVPATRQCFAESATGATLLWLERDCTCGEPLGCVAEAHGAVVDVQLVQNPGPAVCDDCYPSGTTCTLPSLAPGAAAELRVNGRSVLTTTTDAQGRLPPIGCR